MSDEQVPVETPDNTQVPAVEAEPVKASEQVSEDDGTLAASAKGEKPEDDEGEKTGDVPEKYELEMPEGFELDEAMLDTFSPVFKELGITQEQAQKLAETYAPLVEAKTEEVRAASIKSYEETIEGWKAETLKQLGPDSKKELAYLAKVRDKFGDEELSEMLNETGVGNHPAMVRFLIKAGKAISEDAFPDSSTGLPGKADPNDVLYPTMKK